MYSDILLPSFERIAIFMPGGGRVFAIVSTHSALMSRRGGTGFVQEAIDTATGQHVAVKFIPRSAAGYDPTAVSGELLNQRLCAGHPNIIQLQVRAAPGSGLDDQRCSPASSTTPTLLAVASLPAECWRVGASLVRWMPSRKGRSQVSPDC